MKIINYFKKLQTGSKITLPYRKYRIDIFCGFGVFDYGVYIYVPAKYQIVKEYEKFSLTTEEENHNRSVIIRSLVESQKELEVFAYMIEYVLFELGKNLKASSKDIKKYIDDWLYFSTGRARELTKSTQVGLHGELLILKHLIENFPESNQLNNWHGPEGSKIDFIFSENFGLEVKSRIQPFKNWIHISSVEQLENDLKYQHLAVCDFLPSDSGRTLKEIVDEMIADLNNHDQKVILIEKLKKVGFDYFLNYSNLIKLNFLRLYIYDTKDASFPKLPNVSDLRIDKIKYDINISELNSIGFKETIAKVGNPLG